MSEAINSVPELVQSEYPPYRCPSDATAELSPILVPFIGEHQVQLSRSNYAGVNDTDPHCYIDKKFNGVFGRNSSIRFADITAGTNNTLMVGERASFSHANAHEEGIDRDTYTHWAGVSDTNEVWSDTHGAFEVLGTTGFPINAGKWAHRCYRNWFSSLHQGGACFVFCDGSVRFVSEEIDRDLYILLSHRDSNGAPSVSIDFCDW